MTLPEKPVDDLIEAKVASSTLVTLAASIGIAVLNGVLGDSTLLGGLPPVVQALILVLIPPLVTFLAGYATPSNRVGQAPQQRPW